MVKIHFLQKVLKKWSSFREKNKNFFSITGGGSGPYMEFSIIFFFLNPSLITIKMLDYSNFMDLISPFEAI